MDAKSKAKEIHDKYFSIQWQIHKSTRSYKVISMSYSAAKQCAKKSVEEIIKTLDNIVLTEYGHNGIDIGQKYFNEVLTEIDLL